MLTIVSATRQYNTTSGYNYYNIKYDNIWIIGLQSYFND